ncbi:unnamed protein product [Linum tenue]|uniref:Uncharacterized protein n=1 Tax=Linum tenue TaxID=586396 RepID=A0AAV0LWU7_9ROSI|nr:unnamed protein product [Linum tenue]
MAVLALEFVSFLLALTAEQTRRIAFLGAEACLLAGSVKNAQRTKYRFLYMAGDPHCETLRSGVFQSGAILIMISSFASKTNVWWSETEEGAGAGDGCGGDLGAYTPL